MTSFFLGVRCPVLGREFLKAVRYHNSCCKKPKVMFVPTSHKAAFREKIRGQRCCDSKVPNHLFQAAFSLTSPELLPDRAVRFFFETPRHTLLENGLRVVNIFDPNTTQVGLLQFFQFFPASPKITISDPRQLWQWL